MSEQRWECCRCGRSLPFSVPICADCTRIKAADRLAQASIYVLHVLSENVLFDDRGTAEKLRFALAEYEKTQQSRAERETERAADESQRYREQALALSKVIRERDEARSDYKELNDAAADLVAEAVGPYDPPQRGSNLEKLYRLVRRP